MAAHQMRVELQSNASWDHAFDLTDAPFNFTAQGLVARDSVLAFLRRELVVTGVASQRGTVPATYSLSQNYPNPFNPTTEISYQVSGNSGVKLAVYDILGREVAVLVNERKAAGSYTVKFNASGLASGVYLCRLQAGSFVEAKKLLQVR